MDNRIEQLTSLSVAELEALADGMLSPTAQQRLDELLDASKQKTFSPADRAELDLLLERADCLTVLKTRARYTLSQVVSEAVES
ncbi:MAG: hypothetical protein ACRC8S_17440 [Fimbriiglobus sp.]